MAVVLREVVDGRKKKRPGVEEQSEIIIGAAVNLFAQNGARSVSIAQICAYADVSRPTFYRCFQDKDALVAKIYDESVDSHVDRLLNTGNLADGKELRGKLSDLLDAIFQQSQLAQLVFVESNDPDSPAASIVDNAFEHAADAMEHVIAKNSGPALSRVYLKSIMAAVQWIVHDAIKKGLSAEDKQEAKEAVYLLTKKALAKNG